MEQIQIAVSLVLFFQILFICYILFIYVKIQKTLKKTEIELIHFLFEQTKVDESYFDNLKATLLFNDVQLKQLNKEVNKVHDRLSAVLIHVGNINELSNKIDLISKAYQEKNAKAKRVK